MHTAVKPHSVADITPRERLSEWIDGESPVDEPFNLSQVNRDTWDTYHLIGDVMRSADLGVQPSAGFHARLSRALEAELTIVAAPRRDSRQAWRLGFSGAAVAAAVATVVWVAQPFFGEVATPVRVLADAREGVQNGEPDMSPYLEAHRQMAGPSAIRQVSFDQGMQR